MPERACTENEASAGAHIRGGISEDHPLQLDKGSNLFRCDAVLDIRFPGNDAEARAGDVAEHDVRLLFRSRIIDQRIHLYGLDIDDACAADIFTNEGDLVLRQVPCLHFTEISHLIRDMQALSSGRGAHVNDILPLHGSRHFGHKHGTDILRKNPSVAECGKGGQVVVL